MAASKKTTLIIIAGLNGSGKSALFEINARVTERVKVGGHLVPDAKVRAYFGRNGPLIREAILLSDVWLVFDNSELNTPP